MRGIGFTVQTTQPQCSTTHTAAGVCAVCACAVYLGTGGERGCVWGLDGRSQDPFYRLQEVLAGMRVCTSRKCNLNNVYDAK